MSSIRKCNKTQTIWYYIAKCYIKNNAFLLIPKSKMYMIYLVKFQILYFIISHTQKLKINYDYV